MILNIFLSLTPFFISFCNAHGFCPDDPSPASSKFKDDVVHGKQYPRKKVSAGQRRVINGTVADIRHFSYYVFLKINEKTLCGGSLIEDDLVVTAAHCLYKVSDPRNILVTIDLRFRHDTKAETYLAKWFAVYEKYMIDRSRRHDVAVIKLERKIQLGRRATLIPIADFIPPNLSWVHVMGYGKKECMKRPDGRRKEVKSDEFRIGRTQVIETGYNVIVAYNKHNRTCSGDSGGPVVYNDELVAVVSQGEKCCSGRNWYAAISEDSLLYNAFLKYFLKKTLLTVWWYKKPVEIPND